jgi:hypothetical protein
MDIHPAVRVSTPRARQSNDFGGGSATAQPLRISQPSGPEVRTVTGWLDNVEMPADTDASVSFAGRAPGSFASLPNQSFAPDLTSAMDDGDSVIVSPMANTPSPHNPHKRGGKPLNGADDDDEVVVDGSTTPPPPALAGTNEESPDTAMKRKRLDKVARRIAKALGQEVDANGELIRDDSSKRGGSSSSSSSSSGDEEGSSSSSSESSESEPASSPEKAKAKRRGPTEAVQKASSSPEGSPQALSHLHNTYGKAGALRDDVAFTPRPPSQSRANERRAATAPSANTNEISGQDASRVAAQLKAADQRSNPRNRIAQTARDNPVTPPEDMRDKARKVNHQRRRSVLSSSTSSDDDTGSTKSSSEADSDDESSSAESTTESTTTGTESTNHAESDSIVEDDVLYARLVGLTKPTSAAETAELGAGNRESQIRTLLADVWRASRSRQKRANNQVMKMQETAVQELVQVLTRERHQYRRAAQLERDHRRTAQDKAEEQQKVVDGLIARGLSRGAAGSNAIVNTLYGTPDEKHRARRRSSTKSARRASAAASVMSDASVDAEGSRKRDKKSKKDSKGDKSEATPSASSKSKASRKSSHGKKESGSPASASPEDTTVSALARAAGTTARRAPTAPAAFSPSHRPAPAGTAPPHDDDMLGSTPRPSKLRILEARRPSPLSTVAEQHDRGQVTATVGKPCAQCEKHGGVDALLARLAALELDNARLRARLGAELASEQEPSRSEASPVTTELLVAADKTIAALRRPGR